MPIPIIYFIWSLQEGRDRRPNPWGAVGLEWETPSPPPIENFPVTPIVTQPAYAYATEEEVKLHSVETAVAPGAHGAHDTMSGCSIISTRWSSSRRRRVFGMWIFLVTEVLFFGGMFMAYIALSDVVSRGLGRGQPSPRRAARRLQHRRAHRQLAHHGPGRARRAARRAQLAVLFLS